MILVKSKNKNYGINFPENVNEITQEVLNNALDKVNLPKYHAVIALCTKVKLFDFAASLGNSGKDTMTTVVPVLGKIREDDNTELSAIIGETIIIDRSSIERGIHVNTPLSISTSNAAKYINSDIQLKNDILMGKFNTNSDAKMSKSLAITNSPYICLVEFKIVPVSMISATIRKGLEVVDPFVVKDTISC